jgi:hypothetical protein
MSLPEFETWVKEVLAPGDDKFAERKFYDYYQVKAKIAEQIGPSTICEIGVRYGYSAHAFLSAAPEAKYVGYDLIGGGHGGVGVDTFGHVGRILGRDYPQAHVTLLHVDTQKLKDLVGGPFDLVHVDGNHTVAGCLNDLHLAERAVGLGGHILIDDYDYIAGVKEAVDRYVAAASGTGKIERSSPWPSLRGEYVIQLSGGPSS